MTHEGGLRSKKFKIIGKIEQILGFVTTRLPTPPKTLNYMGSTELIASLFRISQTKEKFRKDEVNDATTTTKTHHSVDKEVRAGLALYLHLKKALPSLKKRKQKAMDGQLMLDE